MKRKKGRMTDRKCYQSFAPFFVLRLLKKKKKRFTIQTYNI